MKQMRIVLAMCAALMLMIAIPAASAITVDGEKSTDEWNDNWSYGQVNGTGYDIYDVGDRLEIRQGAFGQDTTTWYEEDPKNDSGPSHDETMAQLGDSSGYDIKQIYGHYDVANDTLYGMSTVYGIPGDLDGDGNIGTDCSEYGDCVGDDGPAGTGMGDLETWKIRISQDGNPTVTLRIQNNNWTVEEGPLGYDDVEAVFSPTEDGVYEISINGVSEIWDVGPCQPDLKVEVFAGGLDDGPGEDTATAFIRLPCPDIMIKKYVSPDNSTWYDAQTQASGPILENASDVYWRYNVTNIGDEPLVDVNVTDNKEGFICDIGDLAVSETEVCYYSGTVPDTCVPYSNVGTTNGIGLVSGVQVDDSDPAHYNCEEKPPNGVPTMTPIGLVALIGMLGFVALRRRD
ncbi:VPXXXP-CTERM sorting domain-containing protein [Methanohalophilus halophilus]|uniref:VPXXXP-CTERM protein sorting domain-containing protein n=1 Tax=Methanohalophilus halophilus TaxID=2177 RepID=A0A1L3Q2K6_9EURY|nr:VPXXXP-CTERM sorting domain-containing protein [Methanohalophilus halophilus]APH39097.1 hypothetical protein BHR79_06095 [Methanohalophilus halophilus]RNI09847.1 VPXXXP-CTERM sorting domain-containing protein [Methanohalophilus halophilus]SDW59449.1 VPXXXP-CTERM protein sorting domain-containing protein [Methanohalophilus halophilus]